MYHRLYGGGDETPVDPVEFAPPGGVFLVAYRGEEAVGCGGFRRAHGEGRAELKRMLVVEAVRRSGIGRAVLAELERRARDLGYRELVLETGARQPEALALYASAGYQPTAPFGIYAGEPNARYFAKRLD